MSTDREGLVLTEAPGMPRLREARFADYPQIYDLESVFFPDSLPPAQRRGLFVDNPLWSRLADTWPIGWVLEDGAGRIVGSINNIPSAYVLGGAEKLCANGHCWAVLPEYRGYAVMLMDEFLSQEQPDLIVSAKVGVDATPVWRAYAQRMPVGDWSRASYVITHYRGFARAALRRKGVPLAGLAGLPVAAALRARDVLRATAVPEPPPSVHVAEVSSFDARFDAFWAELVEQNPTTLLGVRDCAALRWHYGVPLRANRLTILTATRDDRIRAYCVLKQHDRPGALRSMKLVDFQTLEPEHDLLSGLIGLALRRSADAGCVMLEHHGCGLPKMRSFDALAPYRAAKPAWSFYYLPVDPALAERLADPGTWDPSEYDGDSSYK
ncbi:MAG TPA: hypothetical protein VGE11_03590 [Pseudonocardia sp.]